jgi:hypothetical protein
MLDTLTNADSSSYSVISIPMVTAEFGHHVQLNKLFEGVDKSVSGRQAVLP